MDFIDNKHYRFSPANYKDSQIFLSNLYNLSNLRNLWIIFDKSRLDMEAYV